MRKLKALTVIVALCSLVSCGSGASKQEANAAGFKNIQHELASKFGEDAYYTDLTIMHNAAIGNIINTTVTKAPESLTMGQWNLSQNSWKQNSEISLEVPEGTKAADFMFQLNEKINLEKLGGLVEESIAKLKTEKKLKNPRFEMAFIKFPKNGDMAKTNYAISLKPENGGTTFSFYYKLNGDFIEMDY